MHPVTEKFTLLPENKQDIRVADPVRPARQTLGRPQGKARIFVINNTINASLPDAVRENVGQSSETIWQAGLPMTPPIRLDIAVFAHNEADQIAGLIADLGKQDIFACENIDAHVLILANGCSDATAALAEQAVTALPPGVADRFSVLDLAQGGKSRTGHRFIHDLSRRDAGLLGFMDADIELPRQDTLRRMADGLAAQPGLLVFTSRPVKDVVHHQLKTGLTGRLIAAGGDGLTDWRKSICGQLFMVRAPQVRRIGLPAGLPVEDGFFRAMLLTDLLSVPEDTTRIDGDAEVFHVYQSIRNLPELIRHQTRIVLGSAVNAALYRKIRRDAPTEDAAHALLMDAAGDEAWLSQTLEEELPRKPYGYVPGEFLTKRWRRFRSRTRVRPGNILLLLAGLSFDAIIWLNATYKMRRGTGAGYW